jgi:hypothetical protein
MHIERCKSEFTIALTIWFAEQLTFQGSFCFSLLRTPLPTEIFHTSNILNLSAQLLYE